jgi:F-type H+-transporting ATPase subunit a
LLESIYKFLLDILLNQAGKEALPFFSYIYTLFIFICISNLMGVMPFSYTITSHIIVTFSLGFKVLICITLLGFSYQQLKFLNLFVPKNIPIMLLPLLVVIELISFLSRGLSLSIRLFANIMSGHVLMNILTSFIFSLYKSSKLVALLTLFIVLSVSSLELFLAVLQAYVFTVLTCIYLSDALNVADH